MQKRGLVSVPAVTRYALREGRTPQ